VLLRAKSDVSQICTMLINSYLLCASELAHVHIPAPIILGLSRDISHRSFFTSEHHTAAFTA
jgi:hypothetical protein